MSSPTRRRVLAFEQLEPKASPSSILLLLATGGEMDDEASIPAWEAAEQSSGPWRFAHDTQTLLRFIDAHTDVDCSEHQQPQLPTEDECAAADDMMKVDDMDLRAMIVVDVFGY